jgi:hypothetical protein
MEPFMNDRRERTYLQTPVGEVAELALLLDGRAILRPVEFALEPLVDQVEVEVRPLAWERGVALSDSLAPAVPVAGRLDYKISPAIRTGFFGRWEDYKIDSFVLQGLQSYLPGALLLNSSYGDYRGSLVGWDMTFTF